MASLSRGDDALAASLLPRGLSWGQMVMFAPCADLASAAGCAPRTLSSFGTTLHMLDVHAEIRQGDVHPQRPMLDRHVLMLANYASTPRELRLVRCMVRFLLRHREISCGLAEAAGAVGIYVRAFKNTDGALANDKWRVLRHIPAVCLHPTAIRAAELGAFRCVRWLLSRGECPLYYDVTPLSHNWHPAALARAHQTAEYIAAVRRARTSPFAPTNSHLESSRAILITRVSCRLGMSLA